MGVIIHHVYGQFGGRKSSPQPRHQAASKSGAALAPIPWEAWPSWAKELALQKTPADVSLADTVERAIGPFGSQAFKEWYAEAAGVFQKVCQCVGWKPIWAAKYRY